MYVLYDVFDLNKRFLLIIRESLHSFLYSHPRSNEKLKPLHGNIKNDLLVLIKSEDIDTRDINLISLDYDNKSEDIISGRYYDKAVDISIRKGLNPIGAIGVKFVMNNYMQNANNYFENMLGETANIRTANIPYFQIFILFEKMPYFQNGGKLSKWEEISEETHLKKYIKLSEDDVLEYYHTPVLTLLSIISLPKEITENPNIKDKETFNRILREMLDNNTLKLTYSTKFSPTIFKDNVILNDYANFLRRLVYYFLHKGNFNKNNRF